MPGAFRWGALPIGSVLAWAKTLAGVPALPPNWVQMDGQTISEPFSPYTGQIRDMNGENRFPRGNSTSEGVGGESTHLLTGAETGIVPHGKAPDPSHGITDPGHTAHTLGYAGAAFAAGGMAFDTADDVAGSTGSRENDLSLIVAGGDASSEHENKPPYYDVVWIIRIY